MGTYFLMGTEFQFFRMKGILEIVMIVDCSNQRNVFRENKLV